MPEYVFFVISQTSLLCLVAFVLIIIRKINSDCHSTSNLNSELISTFHYEKHCSQFLSAFQSGILILKQIPISRRQNPHISRFLSDQLIVATNNYLLFVLRTGFNNSLPANLPLVSWR